VHIFSAFYFLPKGVLKSVLLKSNHTILKAGVSGSGKQRATPAIKEAAYEKRKRTAGTEKV